jgi:hypothetical protein
MSPIAMIHLFITHTTGTPTQTCLYLKIMIISNAYTITLFAV